MIRYIIIDDEPIAHRIIEKYCDDLHHLVKKGNCYNAFEAMQLLNEQEVDLIFLDINMPKLSGFDLIKSLSNPPKIIVTTAYKEFALEGYELNVSDYLLKPFSFDRFVKAINKTMLTLQKKEVNPSLAPTSIRRSNSFFIKGDKKYHQIRTDEILFIEAYGHYSKLYLKDEMILTSEKISSFEELLPEDAFLRVHKSFIVAIGAIKLIEGNRIGILDHKIPIGQTYKNQVNRLFDL